MENRKISLLRVIFFSITILVLINFSWIWISKMPIHKLSLYNKIFAGRERLPFGDDPNVSYNLSLFDLDAMFASHIVSADHENEIYRIILVGDSSVWGFLQRPEETLSRTAQP